VTPRYGFLTDGGLARTRAEHKAAFHETDPACNEDNPLDNRAGRVTGTLTAADVQTLVANGIAGPTATTPGEFAEVIELVRAGKTYVNVHSTKFTPGEIRSQIDNGNGEHDEHGRDHRDH
jgi:CHRD domain